MAPRQNNKKTTQTDSKSSKLETMADLLAQEDIQLQSLSRGDIVTAKILKVSKREVLADIGAKSYGIIIGREFEHIAPLRTSLQIGDTYKAEIIIPEMESGDTLISLRKTLIGNVWENLENALKDNTDLTVHATRPISGGLLVEFQSLRGFIPQMQLDPSYQDSPDKLVGQSLDVRVLEVDQTQNRLVLSQKEVTQKEELKKMRAALTQFEVGDVVTGTIRSIDRYALSVDVESKKGSKKKLDPASGSIHISEISWERVDSLTDLYNEGDSVESEVLAIDMQDGQLVLSIKKLLPDPWADIAKRYPEEKQISGTVVKVSSIGAFVEIEKGIEGLIHVSKIPADKEFTEGEKITVMIDSLDVDKRKISLAYVPTSKPIGYR